ncbi:yellowish-green 1-like protein [Lentithecium fluviatile CBS 122367]|uniref:Yellowish-green 1-like protein n=1 Tax=Lentithecium fluviatile CBS 122367 TaxID=1168545 RepID=A0A6G1J8C2_9PLEO|nr:yellowish-green 1-like protein [Lentithecium fluviatile CBS 122367]
MSPSYFVGTGEGKKGAHHESISALWELKWKKRAAIGIYPFMEGKLEDFEEVFAHFKENNIHPPYNFDTYSTPFFPTASALVTRADAALKSGDKALASSLYLRAACVYRTARQPCPISPLQKHAFTLQKTAFNKGAALLDAPLTEHLIPHTHALPGTAEQYRTIPVMVRLPEGAKQGQSFPTVLQIYGLDGYRTEHTMPSSHHIARGWASIAVEIPGTGDSPALANDPTSPDRLWSSVLDWIDAQPWVTKGKVVAWGVSCGGYYAMRIAHTHAGRLLGVIAQGGGCHSMFDPEWLEIASHMEYPFDLTQVLALKFGYEDVEEMKVDSRARFSLLENGILERPSCRLLLINGMLDELFPIEDCLLPLRYGSVKEARFFEDSKHMGEPHARKYILEWVEGLFKSVEGGVEGGALWAVGKEAPKGYAPVVVPKKIEGEVEKPVTNGIAKAVVSGANRVNGVKKPVVTVEELGGHPVLNRC